MSGDNGLSGFNIRNPFGVNVENQFVGNQPVSGSATNQWVFNTFAGGVLANIEWDIPNGQGIPLGGTLDFGFTVPSGWGALEAYGNWIHSWTGSVQMRSQTDLVYGRLLVPLPPPTVAIAPLNLTYQYEQPVTPTWTITGAGVISTTATMTDTNGNVIVPVVQSGTSYFLPPGMYTLTVTATTAGGGTGTATATFTVLPAPTVQVNLNPSYTVAEQVIPNWTMTNANPNLTIATIDKQNSIGGIPVQSGTPIPAYLIGVGTHTLSVQVSNDFGAIATATAYFTVTVDAQSLATLALTLPPPISTKIIGALNAPNTTAEINDFNALINYLSSNASQLSSINVPALMGVLNAFRQQQKCTIKSITGPNLICLEFDGDFQTGKWVANVEPENAKVKFAVKRLKSGDVKKLEKLAEIIRKGNEIPQDFNIEDIKDGEGNVAEVALAEPGGYVVYFKCDGEKTATVKAFLVVLIEKEPEELFMLGLKVGKITKLPDGMLVVVDRDISSEHTVVQGIKTWRRNHHVFDNAGNGRYEMNTTITFGFTMRFRVISQPVLDLDFKSSDEKILEVAEDKVGDFTGFSKANENLEWESNEPKTMRTDYFKLTPKENKKSSVFIKLKEKLENKEVVIAQINVPVPKKMALPVFVYFIEDNTADKDKVQKSSFIDLKPEERKAQVQALFDIANTYWCQCGILFEPQLAKDPKGQVLSFKASLGTAIDTLNLSKEVRKAITDKAIIDKVSTKNNLFFLPYKSVTINEKDFFDAYTFVDQKKPPEFNIFSADPEPGNDSGIRGITLGHEFLHAIAGLDAGHRGMNTDDLGYRTQSFNDSVDADVGKNIITNEQCKTAESNLSSK